MLFRFASAASVLTFTAVHAQGSILDTDSEEFKKMLNQSYTAFSNPEQEENAIASCIYGENQEAPTLTEFDGEFEGLAPRDEFR